MNKHATTASITPDTGNGAPSIKNHGRQRITVPSGKAIGSNE